MTCCAPPGIVITILPLNTSTDASAICSRLCNLEPNFVVLFLFSRTSISVQPDVVISPEVYVLLNNVSISSNELPSLCSVTFSLPNVPPFRIVRPANVGCTDVANRPTSYRAVSCPLYSRSVYSLTTDCCAAASIRCIPNASTNA